MKPLGQPVHQLQDLLSWQVTGLFNNLIQGHRHGIKLLTRKPKLKREAEILRVGVFLVQSLNSRGGQRQFLALLIFLFLAPFFLNSPGFSLPLSGFSFHLFASWPVGQRALGLLLAGGDFDRAAPCSLKSNYSPGYPLTGGADPGSRKFATRRLFGLTSAAWPS